MKRLRITIEGPAGSGKTQIRRVVEAELRNMERSYKTYDPVYKFKPEKIDFGDAEAIILVKNKTDSNDEASK